MLLSAWQGHRLLPRRSEYRIRQDTTNSYSRTNSIDIAEGSQRYLVVGAEYASKFGASFHAGLVRESLSDTLRDTTGFRNEMGKKIEDVDRTFIDGYNQTHTTLSVGADKDFHADIFGADLRGAILYEHHFVERSFPITGGEESCKYQTGILSGAATLDWKNNYPRKVINNHKVRGYGMAIAMQGSGIPFMDMGSASIKLNDGGSYMVTVGATDIGQGSDTIISQIVAEELETTVDKIIIYSSDTDLTPFDCGAYASSTTYISGNAAWKAAQKMKKRLIKEAAVFLECKEENVEFDGKTFTFGDKSVSLNDISIKMLYNKNLQQVSVTDYAEVEVDLETGEYEILNYVTVTDCGTTINPMLAKGQVEGGVVQGLGMACFEDVRYDNKGKMISNNFLNYHIPTHKEIHKLTTEFADSYEPTGPFGAKSVGEIGIDTPPAAICNAIYSTHLSAQVS